MSEFVEVPANKMSIAKRGLVHGVGVNDSTYKKSVVINGVRVRCPIYSAWAGVLQRCFDDKFKERNPTYKNCTVCKEWLLFSRFYNWAITQNYKGNAIDKDILVPGNKKYSPESCCFVSQHVNNLLLDRASKRGKYPLGVYLQKQAGKYHARVKINGKTKNLGLFSTPEAASNAYKIAKREEIIRVANEQTNEKVKQALLRIAA